jgi:hypothetical protein
MVHNRVTHQFEFFRGSPEKEDSESSPLNASVQTLETSFFLIGRVKIPNAEVVENLALQKRVNSP